MLREVPLFLLIFTHVNNMCLVLTAERTSLYHEVSCPFKSWKFLLLTSQVYVEWFINAVQSNKNITFFFFQKKEKKKKKKRKRSRVSSNIYFLPVSVL